MSLISNDVFTVQTECYGYGSILTPSLRARLGSEMDDPGIEPTPRPAPL